MPRSSSRLCTRKLAFEDLVLKNTTNGALTRFARLIEWPPHLLVKYPKPEASIDAALGEYFGWAKGNWGIADFLAQCSEQEMPVWVRNACICLVEACTLAVPDGTEAGAAERLGDGPGDADGCC